MRSFVCLCVFGLFFVFSYYIIPASAYGQDVISPPQEFKMYSGNSGEKLGIYFDENQQIGFGIEYITGERNCGMLMFVINTLYPYDGDKVASNSAIKINISIDGKEPYLNVVSGHLLQYPDAAPPIDIYSFPILMTDEFIIEFINGKQLVYSDNTYMDDATTTIDISNATNVVNEVVGSCVIRNKGYNSTDKEYRA